MKLVPSTFRFSPFISLFAVALAALMVWASSWQWERYQYKKELVATYEAHSTVLPLPFPLEAKNPEEFTEVLHQKIQLRGTYDYSRQMIVMNRRHATGPGFWLLTPFKPNNSENYLIVSRGFIPFSDASPESWEQYTFEPEEEIEAIVQETIAHRTLLAPDSKGSSTDGAFVRKWLYPDIEKIAKQLPYPVTTAVFLQRLGAPPSGTFPAESVSIRVPPSTHFGYSIEWMLLALASLTVAYLLQAFPRKKNKSERKPAKLQSLGAIVLGLSTLSCALLASWNSASATERADLVPAQADIKERLGERIDLELQFKDEEGRDIKLADLLQPNRPLILAPVYYECPQLCNLTQTGLVQAVNKLKLKLGEDFSIASVSFNPKEKTAFAAEKAKKYRSLIRCLAPNSSPESSEDDRCLAPNAWSFLTGEAKAINLLMKQIGFGYVPDGSDFIHAAVLLVITPEGKLSRYLYGVNYPVSDVRLALVEASKGRIGTLMDRALLFCFRYDHIQGKYTLSILKVVRVVCLAFFFALITCLLWLRMKEKRPSNPL